MAKNGGNGASSRHGIVAGLVGLVGLFTGCFGFGNQRQGLVVTGAAVVVAAIAFWLFKPMRRTTRQWILGTGTVVDVSDPPADVRYGRCELLLFINAPGLSGEEVRVVDARAPVAHWPFPGLDLPIEIAADDPNNIRVLWKQVPARAVGAGGSPGDWYEDEPPPDRAAPTGSPSESPAEEAPTDFDLDHPPAGTRASGLPPDLGPAVPAPARPAGTGAGGPGADETGVAGAGAEPPPGETVEPPPGETAVPRRRPSPRPRQRPIRTPPVTAPAAGPSPEPVVRPTPTPPREPEPALAGAAAAGTAAAAAGGALVEDLVTTYPSAHPGPAGAINGVGITVLVTDLARSIAFYRDELGFYEVDGGEGSAVLASGETRLVLHASPALGSVTRRSVYLNLEVADIDAVYTELKLSGVRFTNPPRPVNRSARLVQWAATFRDPDGHGIALTQWRPAEAANA